MYGTPVAPLTSAANPYMNMAMQGDLYQNHGMYGDSFQMSDVQSPYVQNYQTYGNVDVNTQIASKSKAGGLNTFNGYGVGTKNTNSLARILGFNGIGHKSNAGGLNTFNGYGVGTKSLADRKNIFGEYTDSQNPFEAGINKTASVISGTPKLILGLAAGIIGFIGLRSAVKGLKFWGKAKTKAKTKTHHSFMSKLNPLNWFKNKKVK